MADEKVIGGGVGGLNTGDTGINDGSSGTGGGGGGSSTQTSTNTSGTSGTSDTSGTSGTSDTSGTSGTSGTSDQNNFSQKEAEIDKILAKWMEGSAIGLTFDAVVDLYLENKLGFGPNGKTLKKKYKDANPDMDPAEIDKEVDEQLEATKKEFTEPGRTGKEELQAKYNEFKAASFEVLGNLTKMGGELGKTIANAYMPTSIGPVAPNPLSVALKLYMGLTALKKLIDRIVISMTVLMAAARSIGADTSPPYTAFINEVHGLLGGLIKDIKDEEEAGDNARNAKKAQYLLEYKKNYFILAPNGKDTIGYKIIEQIARDEFNIYIWPLESKALIKLYNVINVQPALALIPGIGVIGAIIDSSFEDLREKKAAMLIEYNKNLVAAEAQFEKDNQIISDSENGNGSSGTGIPDYDTLSSSGTSGSSGSSGGGNNNNTGNFIQKFTRALFKRING